MKLQNEKCANMKFTVGKETIETDAKGIIEISDKEVADAFLNSGFVKLGGKAKPESKEEPKKESKESKEEKSDERSSKRESLRGK